MQAMRNALLDGGSGGVSDTVDTSPRGMQFYLIDPEGPELRLPVNPEEVTIRTEKMYDTVSLMNLGEVDFSNGTRISEVSFSSFFPAEYDTYCNFAEIPNTKEAIAQLEKWAANNAPIRLIITETNVNMLVYLASCTTQIKGGEPGDFSFDLTLRSWREVKAKKGDSAPQTPGEKAASQREDQKMPPAIYVVKPGDFLYAIAKRQLGKGSRWTEIYALNRATIGPNPNLIKPGQRLVMPK